MSDEGSAQQKGAEPALKYPQEQQQREHQQRQGGERRREADPSGVAPFPPFVGRPVEEPARRYTDDDVQPMSAMSAGRTRTPTTDAARARRRLRLRDERFRKEIFELFESTRGLLTRHGLLAWISYKILKRPIRLENFFSSLSHQCCPHIPTLKPPYLVCFHLSQPMCDRTEHEHIPRIRLESSE